MRSRGLVLLDAASLAAFAVVSLWVAARLGTPAAGSIGWVAVGSLVGIVAADLATGFIHWLGDRCFHENTKWIGPVLIQPFREHHVDPSAITRHGFLEVTGNNALLLLPVLAATGWLAPAFGDSAGASFGRALLVLFAAATLLSNPIHRWAHATKAPAPVTFLQRHWLLLPPAHHARHHAGGHRTHFCVVTGWMNPLVDRMGKFRKGKPTAPGSERPHGTESELGHA